MKSFTKNLLVITFTMAYMVFACNYVMFCRPLNRKHDNEIFGEAIRLARVISTPQRIINIPVKTPFNYNINERPRVINKQRLVHNFFLAGVVFALLFGLSFKTAGFKFQAYKFIPVTSFPLILFCCWRI